MFPLTSLARAMKVDVSHEGELVGLSFGREMAISMPFDLALRVSAMLLVEGRIARRIQLGSRANSFPVFRSMGVLTDLNAQRKRRSRWEKLSARLKAKDVSVANRGRLVALRYGSVTADLPWEAALAIAQLLRIHGRMAKAIAGEKASWDKVADLKT